MPFVAKFPHVDAIQNFDVSGGHFFASDLMAIDWDGRRLFLYSAFNSVLQVNSLDTFGVTIAVTSTSSFENGIQFGVDGLLYGVTLATNCATLHKVDPTAPGIDLATFGIASSNFSTTAARWAFPNDFDTLIDTADGKVYLISAATVIHEITVLNVSSMTWCGFNFTPSFGKGVVTRGLPVGAPESNGGAAQAFVLSANPQSRSIELVQVKIFAGGARIDFAVIALIAASDIAGWTHVTDLRGVLLDQTDGNIIAHITQAVLSGWSGAVTYATGTLARSGGHDYQSLQDLNLNNTPASSPAFWLDLGVSQSAESRIVKVNILSGAIMWTVRVRATVPGVAVGGMQGSRIRFGLYCFIDNAGGPGFAEYQVHQIRTIGGSDTPQVLNNTPSSYQWFDDASGDIVFSCSYTEIGPPVPHGSTPSSFAGPATLGSLSPPFQPAGGVTVPRHRSNAIHYHRLNG